MLAVNSVVIQFDRGSKLSNLDFATKRISTIVRVLIATKRYSYDGLGSVLGEVVLNGNLTATKTYDVYGKARYSAGASTSKHGFVGSLGHPSEDNTGLIYMRARWMDPAVGRFVSEDSSHDGTNWLVYCNDNPINLIDVSGNSPDGDILRALGQLLKEVGIALMLGSTLHFAGYRGLYTFEPSVLLLGLLANAALVTSAGSYLFGLIKQAKACMDAVLQFRDLVGPTRAFTAMAGYIILLEGYMFDYEAACIDGK